jgi:Xaa-Pro aminopeptidase
VLHAVAVASLEVTLPEPDLGRMGRERLARLRHQMAEGGMDALVLLHGPHVSYATGHTPPAVDPTHATYERAVAIVTADACWLFAAGPAPLADEVVIGPRLWPELDDGMATFGAAVRDAVGDTSGRMIGVDEITGAMTRSGVLADADLVDAGRVLAAARLVRRPTSSTASSWRSVATRSPWSRPGMRAWRVPDGPRWPVRSSVGRGSSAPVT